MMKLFAFLAYLVLSVPPSSSQNLVGFSEKAIREYMSGNEKDLSLNNVTNSKFSYLKYSDQTGSLTILFFLGPDSICTGIRMICDENAKVEKIKEFNASMIKKGDNTWIDKSNGKEYLVTLVNDKWTSNITIAAKK